MAMTVPVIMSMAMPVPTASIIATPTIPPAPTATAGATVITASTTIAATRTIAATLPAAPAPASRRIWIARRLSRIEGESDHHIIGSGLGGASDDQLGADRRTQPDRNRRSPIGIGDSSVGVQLAIGHAGIEAKHDRRSGNEAPAGVGCLDDQRRSEGAADRPALLVP